VPLCAALFSIADCRLRELTRAFERGSLFFFLKLRVPLRFADASTRFAGRKNRRAASGDFFFSPGLLVLSAVLEIFGVFFFFFLGPTFYRFSLFFSSRKRVFPPACLFFFAITLPAWPLRSSPLHIARTQFPLLRIRSLMVALCQLSLFPRLGNFEIFPPAHMRRLNAIVVGFPRFLA